MIVLGLTACQTDNQLDLLTTPRLKGFMPSGESWRYVSNTGDTIVLRKLSEEREWISLDADQIQVGGNLPPREVLRAQSERLIIGTDTPFIRFSYLLRADYNSQSLRLADDLLRISFSQTGRTVGELDFLYDDTLQCLSEQCAFADTFNIGIRNFFNVYYTPRDSATRKRLYVNGTRALVGFRTEENQLFELIN
jgi:hypothetical protein